jgi:hypothetical protein
VGAIGVCKVKAPEIAAAAMQKTGMKIKRVSPKNRNPKGVPDAWETQALAALEKRLAAGEKPETLDMHAVVPSANGSEFRYAKALVTQPLCLNCHGDPDKMPPTSRPSWPPSTQRQGRGLFRRHDPRRAVDQESGL